MRIIGVLLAAAAMLVITPVLLAADGEGGPKIEKPRGGEGDREQGPKTAKFSGLLTGAQGMTMTVTRKTGSERNPVDESKTFTVSTTETKVSIETNDMETVPGEGGKTVQRPKVVEGTIADLKIGQRVDVTYIIEGSKAVKVFVRRTPPKGREGGEGGVRPEKPRGAPEGQAPRG